MGKRDIPTTNWNAVEKSKGPYMDHITAISVVWGGGGGDLLLV